MTSCLTLLCYIRLGVDFNRLEFRWKELVYIVVLNFHVFIDFILATTLLLLHGLNFCAKSEAWFSLAVTGE